MPRKSQSDAMRQEMKDAIERAGALCDYALEETARYRGLNEGQQAELAAALMVTARLEALQASIDDLRREWQASIDDLRREWSRR